MTAPSDVAKPKKKRTGRPRKEHKTDGTLTTSKFLSKDELDRLRHTMNTHPKISERTKVLFELAIRTGARAAELLDLRLPDVIPDGKTIFIYALKGGNSRELPIPPALWERARKLAEAHPDGMVFGYGYEWLKKEWNLYRPNKNKTFHSLRHTFGVRLYKKTRDVHLVKMAMGHKSVMSTMVYVNFLYSQTELRKALDVK